MNTINRLRVWLDNYGIDYENQDFAFKDMKIERVKIPSVDECMVSIIQGTGTWGNEDDLLETWFWNEKEPKGYQTINQVTADLLEKLF